MTTFCYKALNYKGNDVGGELEAQNEKEAFLKIRQMSYFPQDIVKKEVAITKKEHPSFSLGGVSLHELESFTTNFHTLYQSRIPILMALEMLKEQQKPGHIRNALIHAIPKVEAGMPLADALSESPKVFDSVYVNMLRVGEKGGILDAVLERLTYHLNRKRLFIQQIQSALFYPLFILFFALIVFPLILILLAPQIQKLLKDIAQISISTHGKSGGAMELPWLTQALLDGTRFMNQNWILLSGIILGIFLLLVVLHAIPKVRFYIDYIRMKLPVFGTLFVSTYLANFFRMLSTLLQNGILLSHALEVVKDTSPNAFFAKKVSDVHSIVMQGFSFSYALQKAQFIDKTTINILTVGEESADLTNVLANLAEHYDQKVNRISHNLGQILGPLLIFFIAAVIAIFAIALILPIPKIFQYL